MSEMMEICEDKTSMEDVYATTVVSKGPDFVLLVLELLQKGVCPRCCLRYCRIGGKDAPKVYGQEPPSRTDMAATIKSIQQGKSITGGGTGKPTPFDGERNPSEALGEQKGSNETGGAKKIDRQIDDCPSDAHGPTTTMEIESKTEGREGIRSNENPAPVGSAADTGPNSIGNHSLDLSPGATCPLCIGILESLSSELQDESTPTDYWAKLPSAEPGSAWKIVPNASCYCLKAILSSCEHLHEEYGLDIQLPECVAMREVAMFRHLEEIFPVQYKNTKFDLGKWPAIGVKVAAKYSISANMNKISGDPCLESASFRLRIKFGHACSTSEVEQLMNTAGKGARDRRGRSRGRFSKRKREAEDKTSEVVEQATWLYPDRLREVIPIPPLAPIGCVQAHVSVFQSKSLYIAGRYIKRDREISQTQFIIEGQRKGKTSVQEVIEGMVLGPLQADSLTFIPAGREDMDVRMLGEGRPFVLELHNPKLASISRALLDSVQGLFDDSHGVVIKGLELVDHNHLMKMKDGEKDKTKCYAAVVWIPRKVQASDLEQLNTISDLEICQTTPIRVAHRRAALSRAKLLHEVKCLDVPGHPNYFAMWVRSSAGTYIKELVHGDMGRTEPSIASLLGCDAVCVQLDVTAVEMETDSVLEKQKSTPDGAGAQKRICVSNLPC